MQDSGDASLPEDAAFVQVTASTHGLRISAANEAAERAGLRIEMALADARAICPSVTAEIADPEEDAAALHRLALWCCRYSPWTTVQAPDGIAIEITGCAHLFGGEDALLRDIEKCLRTFGLTPRLAVAPTIGGAWAAAHHASGTPCIPTAKELRDFLASLPVASLRLDEPTIDNLGLLGLKRIGDLFGKPRAPLVARFGPQVLRRLDQALGMEDETFHPLAPPSLYRAERRFAEPIVTVPAVERAIAHLSHDLAGKLLEAGRGSRCVELELFRVDGWVERLAVRTGMLCREADHLSRLFRERLDRIGSDFDAGFGFDAATLSAFDVEVFVADQAVLQEKTQGTDDAGNFARLMDRFVNRFGAGNVRRFVPQASHVPERGMQDAPAAQGIPPDWAAHLRTLQGGMQLGRPLLLLSPPEPITALSEVPDGPPIRFVWNHVAHHIARADGPERIAPEWWLHSTEENRRTRDYYRVEDQSGRRFWLFRNGLYEREGEEPNWFVHGVFA